MSEYFRAMIPPDKYPVRPNDIVFRTSYNNCVLLALQRRKWQRTDESDWNILWADRDWAEICDKLKLMPGQRVNHFRNHTELTRKDRLAKNLKQYRKALGVEECPEFFPQTFQLPNEHSIFRTEFQKYPNTLWIMKPASRSQGKGIFLVQSLGAVSKWVPENSGQVEPYVIQRYIDRPLLLGGKKFDLRLYLLCTSMSPLKLFVYRSGFARLSHQPYTTDDVKNRGVHCTNVAVQKNDEDYGDGTRSKWDVRSVRLYIQQKFGVQAADKCFENIIDLMFHSVRAVKDLLNHDPKSFELFGYDILLDEHLKPWLLEVNAYPSLTASTKEDRDLKVAMLDDALTIIDMEKVLTGKETQVGGFDLMYLEPGPIIRPSMLGCMNDRDTQLKQLSKVALSRLQNKSPRIPPTVVQSPTVKESTTASYSPSSRHETRSLQSTSASNPFQKPANRLASHLQLKPLVVEKKVQVSHSRRESQEQPLRTLLTKSRSKEEVVSQNARSLLPDIGVVKQRSLVKSSIIKKQ